MSPTDADVMARVQAGDHEVFGLLVTRYAPRLVRVAESKLGDAALAEDVVQEAFLAAFGARQTYKSQFAFSTWLWTILLNLCRRRYQRLQSRSASVWKTWDAERPDPIDDRAPSALTSLIIEEERQTLHRLLAELPEMQADALRLRFFGELSYEEIAAATDCSLSGAKRRVKTGLEKLSLALRPLEPTDSLSTGSLLEDDQ